MTQFLNKGTKVMVTHKYRMVHGCIIRYDARWLDNYGSLFYIVDVGEYASLVVPAHKVQPV